MKRILLVTLFVVVLLSCSVASADYKESEAFNVAQHFVSEALEARGCSKFGWAITRMSSIRMQSLKINAITSS